MTNGNWNHSKFTAEKLKGNENLLNVFINNSIDGVFAFDRNYRYTFWNKGMEEMSGIKKEKIIGKKVFETPFLRKKGEKTFFAKTLKGQSSFIINRPYLVPDTEKKGFYEASYNPLKDDSGKIVGGISVVRDTTYKNHIEKEVFKLTQALQKEKNTLNTIMENTKANLAYFNENLNFIEVNSSFLKSSGLKKNDVIERNYCEVFEGEELKNFFENARKATKPIEIKIKNFVFRKNPRERFWDWTLIPVKNYLGKNSGVVLSLVDVTEEKKIAEKIAREKARDEALLASLGDGVVAINSSGRVLFANDSFLELTGQKKEEIYEKKFDLIPLASENGEFLSPEDRPGFRALVKGKKLSVGTVGKPPYCFLKNKKTREKIPVSITSTPILLQNKVIGAISIYRDISREIEIDRAKSEFLSLAAHELRTPLATMSLTAEMLLKGFAGEMSPDMREYIRGFFRGVQKMTELIKIFLNVSRIDLGTLVINPTPLDIRGLVDELLENFSDDVLKKELKVIRDYKKNLPKISVDSKIIGVAMENLISNAIKYSKKNGKITLGIKVEEQDFIISVSDTGNGILKEEQSKIFTKLFRGKNAIETDGVGLGLYITKYSIEKSGGRVWFESKENEKTTFYIAIPLSGMRKNP